LGRDASVNFFLEVFQVLNLVPSMIME